ncbi:MAG TPA: nucleotidyltransferase family protein [Polyangiaceae bacterium]|nr:nucleotidyltransferase family protein [Polyangiaceae bacterium]
MRALGFRPPLFALDAELEWVLQRAFGALTWSPTSHLDGKTAVDAALRLDMAGRIAARQPRELLEKEMGSDAAQRLREQYIGIVAREALLEHALQQLLEQAQAAAVPCILLKYAALNRMGALRVGARSASDLDVLVPQASARHFQGLLVQNGYEEIGLPESAHQLPALQDRNGALIEVHVHVPAMTLGRGQPFATADDLIAAGLTRPSGSALLPDPAFIAAHALAHGLVQHARAPHMYSALKAFADLADLEQAGHGALEGLGVFLTAAMTQEDLTSALTLARALQRGDLETAMTGPPGVLLRHALASQLDRGYALRLRLRVLTHPGPTPLHLSAGRLLSALREAWHWARSLAPNSRKRA